MNESSKLFFILTMIFLCSHLRAEENEITFYVNDGKLQFEVPMVEQQGVLVSKNCSAIKTCQALKALDPKTVLLDIKWTRKGNANPAIPLCEKQGGKLAVLKDDKGNDNEFCLFEDLTYVDLWKFFQLKTHKFQNIGSGNTVTDLDKALCGAPGGVQADLSYKMPPVGSQGNSAWSRVFAVTTVLNYFVHLQQDNFYYSDLDTISELDVAAASSSYKNPDGTLNTQKSLEYSEDLDGLVAKSSFRSDRLLCSEPSINDYFQADMLNNGISVLNEFRNAPGFKEKVVKCNKSKAPLDDFKKNHPTYDDENAKINQAERDVEAKTNIWLKQKQAYEALPEEDQIDDVYDELEKTRLELQQEIKRIRTLKNKHNVFTAQFNKLDEKANKDCRISNPTNVGAVGVSQTNNVLNSNLNFDTVVSKLKPNIVVPAFTINNSSTTDKFKYLTNISNALKAGNPVLINVCANSLLSKLGMSSENGCRGHVMTAVGFFWNKQGHCEVKLRNSWGKNWNGNGYASISADDFISATDANSQFTETANGKKVQGNDPPLYEASWLSISSSGANNVKSVEGN